MSQWWQQCEQLNQYNNEFDFKNKTYTSSCLVQRITESESQITFTVEKDQSEVFTLKLLTSKGAE
jgi:hypothetical protein